MPFDAANEHVDLLTDSQSGTSDTFADEEAPPVLANPVHLSILLRLLRALLFVLTVADSIYHASMYIGNPARAFMYPNHLLEVVATASRFDLHPNATGVVRC